MLHKEVVYSTVTEISRSDSDGYRRRVTRKRTWTPRKHGTSNSTSWIPRALQ